MTKFLINIGSAVSKLRYIEDYEKKLLYISYSSLDYSLVHDRVYRYIGSQFLVFTIFIVHVLSLYFIEYKKMELFFVVLSICLFIAYKQYKRFESERAEILRNFSRDLESICKQLSILLSTGLSVDDSFDILSKTLNKSKVLARMIYFIEEEKKKGGSISEAISIFARYFRSKHLNNLIVIIVATKERGVNKPSEKLLNLANEIQLERRVELKRKSEKISSKLLMPLMLSLISIMAMLLVPAFLQFNI